MSLCPRSRWKPPVGRGSPRVSAASGRDSDRTLLHQKPKLCHSLAPNPTATRKGERNQVYSGRSPKAYAAAEQRKEVWAGGGQYQVHFRVLYVGENGFHLELPLTHMSDLEADEQECRLWPPVNPLDSLKWSATADDIPPPPSRVKWCLLVQEIRRSFETALTFDLHWPPKEFEEIFINDPQSEDPYFPSPRFATQSPAVLIPYDQHGVHTPTPVPPVPDRRSTLSFLLNP